MKSQQTCELCGAAASLHCEADSAYLCFACDARVHSANFLVARHVRKLTSTAGGGAVTGAGRCCADDTPSAPASPSSSCVSTSSKAGGPRHRLAPVARRREAVLARWSRGLGDGVGRSAAHVMGEWEGAMAGVPARACLAAAVWFVSDGSERVLRELEKCSGVPAKVIVRVEERMKRRRADVEEGWAEC